MQNQSEPALPPGVEEIELYRRMVLARRFDERIQDLRVEGTITGVVHPAIGQEAVAVGVCAHLKTEDRITSTHRGHGHCIAKGAVPRRMMAELYGRRDGYCRGLGGSMHIADFDIGMLGANGIVAAGLPIAMGAALAAMLDGDDCVAVCFFSDGAVGAGPFHEALNIAALWKLPMVFLCENNGWAGGTPVERSVAAGSPHEFAGGYGVPHGEVDGNDLTKVLEAAKAAIEHARGGAGPFLLEAKTFRRSQHAVRGAVRQESRDAALIQHWTEHDPLEIHAAQMLKRGVADQSALDDVLRQVDDCIDDAVRFAERSPFPTPQDAAEGLFA